MDLPQPQTFSFEEIGDDITVGIYSSISHLFPPPSNDRENESDARQGRVTSLALISGSPKRELFADSGINVATRFRRLPRNPDGGVIDEDDSSSGFDDDDSNSEMDDLSLADQDDYQRGCCDPLPPSRGFCSFRHAQVHSLEDQIIAGAELASRTSSSEDEVADTTQIEIPTAATPKASGFKPSTSKESAETAKDSVFATHHHLEYPSFRDSRLCEMETFVDYGWYIGMESCATLAPTDYCFVCQNTTIHGEFSRCYCISCFIEKSTDPYSTYLQNNPQVKADYYFLASIGPSGNKQPVLIDVDPASVGIGRDSKKPFKISSKNGQPQLCRLFIPQASNGSQTLVRNSYQGCRAFTVHKTCFKTVHTLAKRLDYNLNQVIRSMYEYATSVLPVNGLELTREIRPSLDLTNIPPLARSSLSSSTGKLFSSIMQLPSELQDCIIQQLDNSCEAARIFHAYKLTPCILTRTEHPQLYRRDTSWIKLLSQNNLASKGLTESLGESDSLVLSAEYWTMGHVTYMANFKAISALDSTECRSDEHCDKYLTVFNVHITSIANIHYYETFTGPYGVTQISVFFKDGRQPGVLGRARKADLRFRVFCPLPELVQFGNRLVDITETGLEKSESSIVTQSIWASEMPPVGSVVCSSGFRFVTGHHFSYLPFEKDGVHCVGITAHAHRNGITSVTVHHANGTDHTVSQKKLFETQLPEIPLTFMLRRHEIITGLWRVITGINDAAGSFFAVFTNQNRSFLFGPILASIRQLARWSTLTDQSVTKVKGIALDVAPNGNSIQHFAAIFDRGESTCDDMGVEIPSDRTQLIRHSIYGMGSWEIYNSFGAVDNCVCIDLGLLLSQPVAMKITYRDGTYSILGRWATKDLQMSTVYNAETDGEIESFHVQDSSITRPKRGMPFIMDLQVSSSKRKISAPSRTDVTILALKPGLILRWTYSYYASFLEAWDGLCAYHDAQNGAYTDGCKMILEC
ncbi:hypothetical protein HOO65_020851 [Ceratocystis lukuohia]|uniref:F-box domain-containing protein n=1 Tax=Ceratocystis lukuohia TaxID=2019550 RepID=A0ABR4MPT3_9PEZI